MNNFDNDIMISINCITYNHEKYIKDALEGFLMQKTNFKYEILIHEDASTDNTANIIKKYEKKYPKIIKPIYQKENQFSKGIKINFEFNYKRSKGKYIALCEGDDYWTDPYKLQKQVDFLEDHKEFSICFHSVEKIDEDGNILNYKLWPDNTRTKEITTLTDILKTNYIATASVVFRNNLINYEDYENLSKDLVFGDWVFHVLNAKKGSIYFINQKMGVYRKTNKGLHKITDKCKLLEDVLEFYKRLERYFDDENIKNHLKKYILQNKIDLFFEYTRIKNFEKAENILKDVRKRDLVFKAGPKSNLKFLFASFFPDECDKILINYRKLRGIKE